MPIVEKVGESIPPAPSPDKHDLNEDGSDSFDDFADGGQKDDEPEVRVEGID